jgi:hypothetical protein
MNKKPYDILTDFKGSGDNTVDAVALCIMHHRKKKIGLKAIYLKQPFFDRFRNWVAKGYKETEGKEMDPESPLSFDHVNIEKGSIFQSKPILAEQFDDFSRNMLKLN